MDRQRWIPLFIVCVVLVYAAGCGQHRYVSISPIDSDSVVLAFGDSLTSGSGARDGKPYPAVLQELLGCTIINAGVPGETTAEGLRRLPGVLKKHQPTLVILCHGGNDILQRNKPENVTANLKLMVETIKKQGADIVLVGVPRPKFTIIPPDLRPVMAKRYKTIAAEYLLPLEEHALEEILGNTELKSDQIHPNARGYRQLAEAILLLITKAQEK